MSEATEFNRSYYGELTAGRDNYWRLMPAPKMRIDCILARIRDHASRPKTICDFGCGNGALLAVLATHYPDVAMHGIDLSGRQIEQNRMASPKVQWATADLTSKRFTYPFEQACDVAISSEVIEHLDNELDYLANVFGSLRPGGLLVLTTQSGPVHTTEKHVGHVRHWEAEEMARLLSAAGFRQVAATNCGYPFHDLSKWGANLRPNLVIRRFGERQWGPVERATAALLRFLFRFNSQGRGNQLVATAEK
jgi:SAM-dependent methyltransferase